MSDESQAHPALHNLQRTFAASMLDPHGSGAAELERWLSKPPRGERSERFAVYANGYPARTEEALLEIYPAVAHILGAQAFAELTRRYTRSKPPSSYNLNDIGGTLPTFLVSDPANTSLPFLADLAELEWRLNRAFHGRERQPLDMGLTSDWSIDDWQRAVLHFQPSLSLVCSPWPIRTLWDLRDTPRDEIDLDLNDRPERVLVYRSGLEVHCDLIGDAEARALLALIAGRPLGEVAEKLAADGHSAETALAWLPRLRIHGIITGCVLAAGA